MNDMFDDLKAIKSQLKSEQNKTNKPSSKAKALDKDTIIRQKEEELKADFLDYMKDVKKI